MFVALRARWSDFMTNRGLCEARTDTVKLGLNEGDGGRDGNGRPRFLGEVDEK